MPSGTIGPKNLAISRADSRFGNAMPFSILV